MKELKSIEGVEITQRLLEGWKIIWNGFDGEAFHLLLESTIKENESNEANKWKFLYFEQFCPKQNNLFSLGASYRNQTRITIKRKVRQDFFAAKQHITKYHNGL